MNPFIVFSLVSFFLVMVLFIINQLISVHRPDMEKVSPYECGFSPFGDARQKFNVQFYLVGILFIIFDVELLFLFPYAVVMNQTSTYGFWLMVIFIVLLTVGFVYEWSLGALYFTRQPNDSISSDNTHNPLP